MKIKLDQTLIYNEDNLNNDERSSILKILNTLLNKTIEGTIAWESHEPKYNKDELTGYDKVFLSWKKYCLWEEEIHFDCAGYFFNSLFVKPNEGYTNLINKLYYTYDRPYGTKFLLAKVSYGIENPEEGYETYVMTSDGIIKALCNATKNKDSIFYNLLNNLYGIVSTAYDDAFFTSQGFNKNLNSYERLVGPQKFFYNCIYDYYLEYNYLILSNDNISDNLVIIPELTKLGQIPIFNLLNDVDWAKKNKKYSDKDYYYRSLLKYAFQIGYIIAGYWHYEPSNIDEEEMANLLDCDIIKQFSYTPYKKIFETEEKFHNFFLELLDRFNNNISPYWQLRDYNQYIFNAILASYVIGISVRLANLGYE